MFNKFLKRIQLRHRDFDSLSVEGKLELLFAGSYKGEVLTLGEGNQIVAHILQEFYHRIKALEDESLLS